MPTVNSPVVTTVISTVFKPTGPTLFLILPDISGMQSHADAQTNRGFWGARSREPPYRMNAGCFPNPNQKKSVSIAFGLSFPFGSWGGVARV